MREQIRKTEFDKSWNRFSEQPALERLKGLGINNIESAFQISSETNSNGDRIEEEAEIYWVKFSPPADFPNILPAEGKLYVPKQGKQEKTLIHYAPSFPQGNAGRFEKRYIKDFVQAGYFFFAGRHNGASMTTGETLNEIINAPKRLEIAKECGEQHLGGTKREGYLPSQLNDEPITSLSALAGAFQRIHLVAQSLGASAHYNAVTKLKGHPEVLEKIKNIVSIAGYVGKDIEHENGIWDGTKIPAQEFGKHQIMQMENSGFNFSGTLETFLSDMKKIAHANAKIEVPPNIGNILFFTPKDDFIAGPKNNMYQSLRDYGPKTLRKLIVLDDRMKVGGERPHSMDWITVKDLIAAIEAKLPAEHALYRHLLQGDSFVAP